MGKHTAGEGRHIRGARYKAVLIPIQHHRDQTAQRKLEDVLSHAIRVARQKLVERDHIVDRIVGRGLHDLAEQAAENR